MSRSFTADEVAKHNTEKDLWTVINGDVYDLTKFIDMHPGGTNVLLATAIAGGDASEAFFSMHRSEVLTKYQRLKIGRVSDPKSRPYLLPIAGELSPVPMAEPGWLVKEFRTPYYDDSHRRLQREMRKFFDTEVKPEARVNEGAAERPSQRVMELMGSPEWEINAMRMGPGPHLQGRKLPGGIKPEEFTYFHELVVIQELVRVGAPGYMAGLNAGMVIGLPPVLNFGSEKMRKEVLPDILRGKTIISLAISEAAAGSDVQGMTTKGTKTADGKYWEVTGNKKWITCGHYSDYFMTGVRTGPGQLSMMLIPRKCETRGDGVDTRIIKTSYSSAAGTAWVTFDKVLVPVENVLGGEGNGLKVILSNFNHERWVICCRIARYSRVIYEETFKWAHLRKVFGKPLIEQPVVRAKFALMLAKIEAGQTWLENLTFQMCNMKYEQQSKMLAGPMALLKYFLSRSQGEIVDEAVQIWGGRGITASGMGVYIEQAQRTYKFDSILGGSEEVLAQLGGACAPCVDFGHAVVADVDPFLPTMFAVRQASKQMPRAVL